MSQMLTPERPDPTRDDSSLRRVGIPSWLGSLLLHLVILLILTLTIQIDRRQGAVPERTADVGIALKHSEGGGETFETDSGGDPTDSSFDERAAKATSLQDVMSDSPPVDPASALPRESRNIGSSVSAGGQGIGSALGTDEGRGGRGGLGAASGTTSVFGIPGTGSKFIFVFDRSASMGGSGRNALSAAKNEMIKSLESLEQTHQFQIIFYNEQPWVFNPSGTKGKLAFATEQNKQHAKNFIGAMTASGATRHESALYTALSMQPDVIFFLTDANDPQLSAGQLDKIQRRANGVSINTIEFGLGPKRSGTNFLERLARQNGGQHGYVDISKLATRKRR